MDILNINELVVCCKPKTDKHFVKEPISLDYNPFLIRASYSSIVVLGSRGLFFYDLETRIIKKLHQNVEGCMSQIGSNFYIVSANPHKKTFCFDADGNLIEEINMDRFGKLIDDEKDGSLFCVNDNLFIVSFSKDKVLKL
jgi:hypothetical protein